MILPGIWRPFRPFQVKPGGILAGHDFAPEKPQRFPGPFLAAKAFARTEKLPRIKWPFIPSKTNKNGHMIWDDIVEDNTVLIKI